MVTPAVHATPESLHFCPIPETLTAKGYKAAQVRCYEAAMYGNTQRSTTMMLRVRPMPLQWHDSGEQAAHNMLFIFYFLFFFLKKMLLQRHRLG